MFFPKMSVYAIMKDEIANIDEFVDQFKQVDHIILLDTGSTDGTYERAKEIAETDRRVFVTRALFDPFNFSTARNMAMKIAVDFAGEDSLLMWADLDERVVGDWYTPLVEWFDNENLIMPTAPECTYFAVTAQMLFHVNDEGAVLMQYPQKKIHTTGFTWKYACHEVLEFNMMDKEVTTYPSKIMFRHFKDESKERNYMDILEAEYVSDKTNLRSIYYYGRELYYARRYDAALDVLNTVRWAEKEVTMPQMVEAYLLAGEVAEVAGKNPEPYWFCSLGYNPNCATTFFFLARHCYNNKDLAGQLYWAIKGINALQTAHINVIYNRKAEIAWQLYDFAGLANDAMGNNNAALQLYAILLQDWIKTVPPDDVKRIQSNVQYLVHQVSDTQPIEA